MAKAKKLTRRQRWAPYVRQLGDALRLKDWRIEVSEETPSSPDALATCQPVHGRRYAILRFAESFLVDEPKEQRHTIVHELLHCHLEPLWRSLAVQDRTDPAATLSMEYSVDGLADAIAPLLPMPPASTRSQH